MPMPTGTLSLRVIGGGRAGMSLHRALHRAGWDVHPIVHHHDDLSGAAAGVDLLVIAVPDHAIEATAARVGPGAAVVAHLAGSLGLAALGDRLARAALHPMVALPDPAVGATRLGRGAWFAVAADADAQPLIDRLVADLNGRAVPVPDERRALHHAACVMAANHLVALAGQVERVAELAGVPAPAYLDLARGALDAIGDLGPAAALTGPVSRGDWATIDRHLAALPDEERPAYLALAGQAARLAARDLPADLDLAARAAAARSSVPVAGAIEVHDTKAAFRKALDAARSAGLSIGLVPTMGALHAGHASLVERAAMQCDVVAVTVFVNPLQFDRTTDLDAYPRTLGADLALVQAAAGVRPVVVLTPSVQEMYGSSPATTAVSVGPLAGALEGASRPGHFDGVATVVTKLVSLAGPCRAYFGDKDFQQVAVIRRLVNDLDLAVEVVGCPTVRADDGLALSSRNAYLTDDERELAPALSRALRVGAVLVADGMRDPAAIAAAVSGELAREPAFRLDRIDVVDAATLAAPTSFTAEIRILGAAFLGAARLIDNVGVRLDVPTHNLIANLSRLPSEEGAT